MFEFNFGFGAAQSGIMDAIRNERNFRLQWLIGMMVLLLIDLISLDFWQEIALFMLVFLVLVSELKNCAIEKTCDSFGKDPHVDKKRAKDFAAGSVLLMSTAAALVFFLFVADSREAMVKSMLTNAQAYGACALVLLCNLPMALTVNRSRAAFILFLVSLPINALSMSVNYHMPGFWLVGAGFHVVMAIAYGQAMATKRWSL